MLLMEGGTGGSVPVVGAFARAFARMSLIRLNERSAAADARIKDGPIHWLPVPRILHPWPNVRFRRRYPRQEPHAVMPHVGICAAGVSREGHPYRDDAPDFILFHPVIVDKAFQATASAFLKDCYE